MVLLLNGGVHLDLVMLKRESVDSVDSCCSSKDTGCQRLMGPLFAFFS